MFSAISGAAGSSAQDALEEYLGSPPRTTVKDALVYWNASLESGSEDAVLARMALDYLSIPGMRSITRFV